MLEHPDAGYATEYYVAYDAGALIATYNIGLPVLDNTDTAMMNVVVKRDRRRAGIGRRLFDHAVRRIREHGRSNVIGRVREPYPGRPDLGWRDADFARSVGAMRALQETRWRLDVPAIDDVRLNALEAATWQLGHSAPRIAG